MPKIVEEFALESKGLGIKGVVCLDIIVLWLVVGFSIVAASLCCPAFLLASSRAARSSKYVGGKTSVVNIVAVEARDGVLKVSVSLLSYNTERCKGLNDKMEVSRETSFGGAEEEQRGQARFQL